MAKRLGARAAKKKEEPSSSLVPGFLMRQAFRDYTGAKKRSQGHDKWMMGAKKPKTKKRWF